LTNGYISDERRAQVEDLEDHEDILHPLREAANRVGREVERFAEVLDGYNPLKATAQDEKHEMVIDLINLYHGIALQTLESLRDRHATDIRKQNGLRWRRKMRGFKITQDEDELEEDSDEMQYGGPRTTLEDLARWEQEAQTWDLLRRLVRLRFPAGVAAENDTKSMSRHRPLHQYSTESEVWESFLEADGLALERRTVLQWLNETAEESGEDIDALVKDLQQNAERGDIIAHGWLHTKAAIKNEKRIHTWPHALDPTSPEVQKALLNNSRTESLVTQLDPDAMARQNRKLEAQDEYFERSIWLGCYEMLRRGRPTDEIREWCMERTEIWRAISMLGLPDQEPGDDDETGNQTSSALWRRICFDLARKSGGDKYERAVYGILSGDILSVEDVCKSWDDFIFIHYNALLRTQFDNYVQKLYPERAIADQFGVFDAVQFHGDPKSVGKRLVETLKRDARTSEETLQPMKMLQGILIANEFEDFIYQQGLALSKLANANGGSNLIPATKEHPENEDVNRYIALDDHDSLRVLTHVLLIFISLGVDLGGAYRQTSVENVIVSYISFLRLAGKEELIPLYCSQLSGNRRYATLCRNLIDVTDPEQRVTQIRLMRELGLDVQEFVKFQSRYLFTDYPDSTDEYPATDNFNLLEGEPEPTENGQKLRRDFFGDDPDRVERIDMLFIRSLEWYLLVDGLWSETFIFGTMLYLRFFSGSLLSILFNNVTNLIQSTCILLQLECWPRECPARISQETRRTQYLGSLWISLR
jgi:nuclear pore complex protein Nup107